MKYDLTLGFMSISPVTHEIGHCVINNELAETWLFNIHYPSMHYLNHLLLRLAEVLKPIPAVRQATN